MFSSWSHKRQHEHNCDPSSYDLKEVEDVKMQSSLSFLKFRILTDTKSALLVLKLAVRSGNPRVVNLIVNIARNHNYVLGRTSVNRKIHVITLLSVLVM